jgi:hypothetical protein
VQHSFNLSAPVIIGGVGGSGTRMVTRLLMEMGFYMGNETNSAYDNLWFRFLLNRPEWYTRCKAHDRDQITKGFQLFTQVMTGTFRLAPAHLPFLTKAVMEQRWRGVKRAIKLMHRRPIDSKPFTGWGWKEPAMHVFLEDLREQYPDLKYIHTVRHGLDIAFTDKLGQLFKWSHAFDLEVPTSPEAIPSALVEFWIRANQRAVEIGEKMGPEKFFVLNFDQTCASPQTAIKQVSGFLGVRLEQETFEKICGIPKTPKSKGRYKGHDLGQFSQEQIDQVRASGFPVETGPAE